jgi:transcriptional regulator with XRE-family HTH domain
MARPTSSEATRALGKRVKAHRHALGISQEALAHRCDLHWTFVGQVERGQRNPRLSNLLKIAAGLDVDPGELVSGLKPPARDGEQSRP